METIQIRIKNGKATLHVQGMKGESCQRITAQLEALLGKKISNEQTPEFFERDETDQVGIEALQ